MTSRSLALNSAGRPHIAYGGKRLYYAWLNGTEWQLQTVDETSGVGQYASLTLDQPGKRISVIMMPPMRTSSMPGGMAAPGKPR